MSNSRTKMLPVVALAAVIVSYLAFTYLRRPQPSSKETVAFVRSVHSFVEARTRQGSPLPPLVQLSELVDGGYITSDMARRFDGSRITFPPGPSNSQPLESTPQQVLIHLRLPDGRETVMTADGSLQALRGRAR